MTPKTNDKQFENERKRRRLRFTLLKDVLRCESVKILSNDHKKLLFRLLANGWSISDVQPDVPLIRTLKKTASDARRLQAALGGLDAKDAASLDSNYRQSIPLSTRLLALKELAHDADALADVIKGEHPLRRTSTKSARFSSNAQILMRSPPRSAKDGGGSVAALW